MAESQSNDNNTCVVCFKNVVYYSVGECDHPVCFECSTRMRVLCLQNECPICRQALSRVVFTDTVYPYKELRSRIFTDRFFERQFKIGFCSEEIKRAYEQLLENRCKLCDNLAPFRTFSMLSDHMRKVHERYFCDLCVKHLKIFTNERKCYTRQELAHHRRKGDLDDTSHRGHPLCEFCEERFMDADELYRHLRKEHLYCHLCDADGRNLYYATHAALAHHFRTDHYLCEEGDCAGNHLTAVFRTEIDLKAHKATVHGRGMTRGAARQARTLELQFNITPHPVVQRSAPRDRDNRDRERERDRECHEPSSPPPAAARIDTRSDEQFPRLSAAPPAHALLMPAPSRAYKGVDGLARTDKNFPTLGGAPGPSRPAAPAPRPAAPVAATILRNSKPSVSIQLHSQPASASSFRLTQTSGHRPAPRRANLDDDDFPSLGVAKDDHPSIGAGTVQPSKVAVINSQEMQALKSNNTNSQPKKQQLSSEAFPALSAATTPAAPPQWITVSKDKAKTKPAKAEPPPKPREPAFNPAADFPTLPNNNKSKKKTPQPQPQPQPPPASIQTIQTETKLSKKEKKKQNNVKKENSEPATPTYVNGFTDKFTKNQMKEAYNVAVSDAPAVEIDRKIKTVDENSLNADNNKKRNGGNGDFALKAKDYPPLSSKSANAMPAPATGKKACQERKPVGNAPPGFSGVLRPPPCDGMTFTNSSGQTFPAPPHAYIPPPAFEARNRALVNKFAAALGGAAAVEDFKVASRAFRDNIIGAEEFYQHCKSAMGAQLDGVFPELVALLPDIGKQQELVVGRDLGDKLDVCGTCGQLTAAADRVAHDTAHWPPLAPP
ncbi:E3 ubiquitin-protein ligase ZNF598 isoform X2 [Pectinophora gossypiella]|uniref:E3 ubiquitin-protein ligase ZNF598 isoform X2 n=1 Tax=Pectinophora gossypiella TaxID=13191 RepID=UPI00214F2703|nr:E3 ubiquitin-protein ligase ZNF598 isoform X2 [Pectinophora gossypiella]